MLAAFALGLFGSVGHCAGMCSGVALLLGRSGGASGWRVLLLHLGRTTTYGVMGLVAGGFGHALATMGGETLPPGLSAVQGTLALVAASLAVYMAIAFVGRAPSPELVLHRVTRWWGDAMHRASSSGRRPARSTRHSSSLRGIASTYGLGLLWGLLPCGLVLMALLLAAVAGSARSGALIMIVFGLSTWPLVLAVTLAPRLQLMQRNAAPWVRPAAAAIVLVFAVQMALRGLAAWGMVGHQHLGGLMLW